MELARRMLLAIHLMSAEPYRPPPDGLRRTSPINVNALLKSIIYW